ncbi:MAG: DegT/DnrJ/EryC1/StrS family aminotransferase [Candidatus Omnitrophica bacterium]|nr:DegT/DnrJ/EryC1/StrS family aminotransferase [Candidatus Omnitrophota bacterium]
MPTTQSAKGKKSSTNRRQFLAASLSTGAITVIGAAFKDRMAYADVPYIRADFISPQYYDGSEGEALLDVLKEKSPFRYYGPGNPVKVKNFESALGEYIGAKYPLCVTSGTAALDCAVTGLEIGPGDEVIMPAYTWWSDYTCVVQAGALPVFADIDESLTLDPLDFERRITPRTKAVIPVHLLGGPCDMDPILEIAKKHGIQVLEDAAQCVGGSYKGKKLGNIGDVGIYSFQFHKMISSGEGGALVTNNPIVYERASRFHDMGVQQRVFIDRIQESRVSDFAGENFRMSEFTGAVLGAQLPKLDAMVSDLRRNFNYVLDGIKNTPGLTLRKRPDPEGDIGYGIFVQCANKEARDRFIAEMGRQRVGAGRISGSVLLPIAESIMNKRARHPQWPSFNTPQGKAIEYGPDSCRQTLRIYDQFVQIRIGPKFTNEMNDRMIDAILKSHATVA